MEGLLVLIFGGVGVFVVWSLLTAGSSAVVPAMELRKELKDAADPKLKADREARHQARLAKARANILYNHPNFNRTGVLDRMAEHELLELGESLPSREY